MRLVDVAARQAAEPSASWARACGDDPAGCLGGYRLLENDQVDPAAIAQAGFAATAEQARTVPRLLAISDTTSLGYHHAVAGALGRIGNTRSLSLGGWQVHSSLLLDGTNHQMLGLLDQQWRQRSRKDYGRKHRRQQRAYRHKESFKWQASSQRMAERLGPQVLSRVIELADAEADIYEYLAYKCQERQRFIVRVAQDRALSDADQRLWAYLAAQPVGGQWEVDVPQRGGRAGRIARVAVRSAWVTLRPPRRPQMLRLPPPGQWAVLVQEADPPNGVEPLCWRLYSSEPAETFAQARQVAEDYAQRPQIEVFHKAWKSGCRVEERRQQDPQNLQRMGQILAFIAVRLVQLSQLAHAQPNASCEPLLERPAWQCLWQSVEPQKPLPKNPPSCQWTIQALGRLGGFQDTKRTGRIGWQTIWHGYRRLQERLLGYLLAQGHKM
jgi:hypothetical protein